MLYATRITGWSLSILIVVFGVSTAVAAPPHGAPAMSATGRISVGTTAPAPGEAGVAALGDDTGRTALPKDLHRGWPLDLNAPGAGFPYTPTLFDADSDGADEIFLTGGETFGLRGDGTFLPGWPTTEHAYMGYGTNDQKPGPSVADLDGDGDYEILWSERDWWAGSAHMWCFNARNFDGTNLPNFPQFAPDDYSNALDVPFVLGNTDADAYLEAWGPHSLGNAFIHYRISAFDHLGTRLFTHDMNASENALSLYYGDLDGNGATEMFTVTWMSPSLYLHAFTSTGSEQAGYPILLYTITSGYLPFGPPVITDLDHDGDLEILIGQWSSSAARVRAFHHDATPVAGWPIQIATNFQLFYIGLGDLTGDGVPELIATGKILSSNYRVFAIDIATAAALPGWPYVLPYWPEGLPSVADVNNDGYQDVCISTDGGDVRAIGRDGVLLAGYPKTMSAASISGAAVGDIDGDGLFELVAATWDGVVYAWDTEGAALPSRAEWPMRGVDARYTGIFVPWADPTGVAGAGTTPRLGLRVEPNPVFARATLRLGDAANGTVIGIFDAAGRQIDALRSPGSATLTWTPPRGTVPGIYFALPQGATASEATRIVLMR
jgi:hypothetical protein